jgi:hypothetical protein
MAPGLMIDSGGGTLRAGSPMTAFLALGIALAAEPVVAPQVWAGHQRTVGTRKVPLLGEIRTVTDVYTIATVEDRGGEITLVETPCTIAIQSGAGVKLAIDPKAVQNIPPPTIHFADQGGALVADTWNGGWGVGDVDKDGSPGFRVAVHAPVCSGSLDIGSDTESNATARRDAGGIYGNVSSTIHRRVLDWSNACLGLVAKEQREPVSGSFRYTPADATATCSTAVFPGI